MEMPKLPMVIQHSLSVFLGKERRFHQTLNGRLRTTANTNRTNCLYLKQQWCLSQCCFLCRAVCGALWHGGGGGGVVHLSPSPLVFKSPIGIERSGCYKSVTMETTPCRQSSPHGNDPSLVPYQYSEASSV